MKTPSAGQYRVRHPERETAFMLSVMSDSTGAILGVCGYEIGEKPPERAKHLLQTGSVRHWIGELQPEPMP